MCLEQNAFFLPRQLLLTASGKCRHVTHLTEPFLRHLVLTEDDAMPPGCSSASSTNSVVWWLASSGQHISHQETKGSTRLSLTLQPSQTNSVVLWLASSGQHVSTPVDKGVTRQSLTLQPPQLTLLCCGWHLQGSTFPHQ